MVTFVDHIATQQIIVSDGQEVGYVDKAKGSDVALIVSRAQLSDAALGRIVRALDDRDGDEFPNRHVCMLGLYVLANEIVEYAS